MMEHPEDAALLRDIAGGSEEAFGRLYDRYGRLAYSLAWRVLRDSPAAEDAVQEAFLNVWRKAGSFDGRRGDARSWLLSVVHHRAVDLLRRSRGQQPLDLPAEPYDVGGEADEAWRNLMGTLDRQALEGALARIPPDQRHVIELAYFGGHTHKEIAAQMQVPVGTVKGRIRIGMEKLRRLLAGDGTEA